MTDPLTPEAKALIEKLRTDLAKNCEAVATCESCSAPLFADDDFVSGEDCSGCWSAMIDTSSKRERPCYAYRVEKPDARTALNPSPASTELIGDAMAPSGLTMRQFAGEVGLELARHGMRGDQTLSTAGRIVLSFLADNKIAFGNPAYDWTIKGAKTVAHEYEIRHWEESGASSEGES